MAELPIRLGRLDVPLAALAKEREELFRPECPGPTVLRRGSQGLYLAERVRDEAHRFALTYHRSLRAKRSVRSVLDEVAGVRPRRKRALLRRFGSLMDRSRPLRSHRPAFYSGAAFLERRGLVGADDERGVEDGRIVGWTGAADVPQR